MDAMGSQHPNFQVRLNLCEVLEGELHKIFTLPPSGAAAVTTTKIHQMFLWSCNKTKVAARLPRYFTFTLQEGSSSVDVTADAADVSVACGDVPGQLQGAVDAVEAQLALVGCRFALQQLNVSGWVSGPAERWSWIDAFS